VKAKGRETYPGWSASTGVPTEKSMKKAGRRDQTNHTFQRKLEKIIEKESGISADVFTFDRIGFY
jgi:hypothetical protein